MSSWIEVDEERVCANWLFWMGERLTRAEVRTWLRQLGLRPHPAGNGWLAGDEALAAVQNSGIIDFRGVPSNPLSRIG